MANVAATGEQIAKQSLKKNYDRLGITAGRTHFSDVWARDAFFATLGTNKIGDHNISRITLLTFIKHQGDDGQIPLRVGDRFIQLKFLGIHTHGEHPIFDQDKGSTPALDPNCLFIIAAHDYVETYGDWSFVREHYQSFMQAMLWLEQFNDNDDVLLEQSYGGWTDSLKKEGSVLYTNACYYKALKVMEILAKVMKTTEQHGTKAQVYAEHEHIYKQKAQQLKAAIQELYNGEYFIDGIESDGTKRAWFSTDGNVLAILWGIANKTQTKHIIDYAQKNGMEDSFSVQLNHPSIPKEKKSLFIRLAGIGDYHDGMLWPWIGALYCVAKDKAYPEQGRSCLDKIGNIYERDGMVQEVYETDGKPVNRLFYKSEKHFAWGAGLYLYAYYELV